MSADERNAALEVVVTAIGGKVPVIVGASAGTASESGVLAAAGAERGASAAMVMAPASVGQDVADLIAFFDEVGERGGLPIILQNAPPPIGSGLPVEAILEVASRVEAVSHIKEETLPCGQRITRLLDGAPESLAGVIGGSGCIDTSIPGRQHGLTPTTSSATRPSLAVRIFETVSAAMPKRFGRLTRRCRNRRIS